MGKLDLNPDFGSDEEAQGSNQSKKVVMVDEELVEEAKGDLEEKETSVDETEEEGDQPDASTGEEPVDKSVAEDDVDDTKAIAAKERELEGLEKEESKLGTQLTKLDEDIKAAKERIVAKRTARREAKRTSETTDDSPQTKDDDLSDIEQEDIERMERILRAKGYAPKAEHDAESFKSGQQVIEDAFYETNPQYKPENDDNDVLYDALQKEIAFFAKPKNAAQVKGLLQRAHKEVKAKYPSRFVERSSKAEVDTANRAKMKIAGTASGTSGPSAGGKAKGKTNLGEKQIQALQDGGFSDEEIAEM